MTAYQVNVLVDHGENAMLCDFGLSRIKADVTSRSAIASTNVVTGSRHWMAPERLKGQMLKRPSDMYSFGMTIFEVYYPFPRLPCLTKQHHQDLYK